MLASPIKYTIINKVFPIKQILEKLSKIIIIWSFKEIQPPHIPKVGRKFLCIKYKQAQNKFNPNLDIP